MTTPATSVLIIGGYGIVGRYAAQALAADPAFSVTIAGHNKEKAKSAANALGVAWLQLDATDEAQVAKAVADIDVIINCFIELDRVAPVVARVAARLGKIYLDVAGVPLEHLHAVKAMDAAARETGAVLLTGLGVNPGIAGLLLQLHAQQFGPVVRSELLFVLGSDLRDVSLLSMRGLGKMINLPPQIWKNGAWRSPETSSLQRHIGPPFEKKIWLGPSLITPDIALLPHKYPIQEIYFWSGIENLIQSMAMIYGIRLGLANGEQSAKRFLQVLKWLGGKTATHELNVTLISTGLQNSQPVEATTSIRGSEMFATAIAPVVACKMLAQNRPASGGAFYPTEILDPAVFTQLLPGLGVPLETQIKRL